MPADLVFLEGAARDASLEMSWREFGRSRALEAWLAFARRLMDTAWGRRCWRRPALIGADGRIEATMSLYDLRYRLDGRRLRLGGIGSLVVREDLRRHGRGRFFMKSVHDLLREEGFDGALLFSSIGVEYYARQGYVPLPLAAAVADFRSLAGVPARDPVSSTIRPFREADLAAVRNLFNTTTGLQRLAPLRDDDYWEIELLRARLGVELFRPPATPAPFLVGERDGSVVSYLRTSRRPDRGDLVVEEYAVEAGAREDVLALLQWLLERMGADAPEIVRGVVPTRFGNLPARRLVWRREESHVMMMKSFGGFEVPFDLQPDERLVWVTDWF